MDTRTNFFNYQKIIWI